MSDRVLRGDAIISSRGQVVLAHYGMPRRSGRYPWGSGENPYQHTAGFRKATESALEGLIRTYYPDGVDGRKRLSAMSRAIDEVAKGYGMSRNEFLYYTWSDMRNSGKSANDIAAAMGMSTGQYRSWVTVFNDQQRVLDVAEALALKDKGYSNTAIAQELGYSEGKVRQLLQPDADAKARETVNIIDNLRQRVDAVKYVDVGKSNELYLDISKTQFDACVDALKNEGYHIYREKVPQAGGNMTTIKVLTSEDYPTFKAAYAADPSIVKGIGLYSDDAGETIFKEEPPVSIDSKRIFIRYGDQKGVEKDGLIELRPGVEDLDLTDSKYAQVRIAVDGTHYMKGMAIRSDDIPDGYDVVYNTNKPTGTPPADVFKKLKDDPVMPFGAAIDYQKHYTDADGVDHVSALNIVNDEGTWNDWSRNLASQMLSKQSVSLATDQLKLVQDSKQAELDDILALTNTTVQKKLLAEYAESCDAAAEHLKAAALPRQKTQVILPIPELKDNEIYAEGFRDGEKVVLVRYPHAGPFESPELIVNNKNPAARKLLKGGLDCVGINSAVAERLSGADFDGDNVIVIPNNDGKVKVLEALPQLKGFDPKSYKINQAADILKAYEQGKTAAQISKELGVDLKAVQQLAKPEKSRNETKNDEMGKVSNLITDMHVKGAPVADIARAVKHSMVVIDSVKHNLDYKASYELNGIAELKEKWQGGKNKGASTLISRASGQVHVDERKEVWSKSGLTDEEKAAWDRGEKLYRETGRTYTKRKQITDPSEMTDEERVIFESGKKVWRTVGSEKKATTKTTGMRSVSDARELSSGADIEEVYADHANALKSLANRARAVLRATPPAPTSASAKKVYAAEVESLKTKLKVAKKNQPVERQALLITNARVKQALEDNPDMSDDALKKVKSRTLQDVRNKLGANKKYVQVVITDREWEAIQAGAIADTVLTEILNNTDMEKVKERATPRSAQTLTNAQMNRIQTMYNNGMTQAEIADALGVSTNTVIRVIVGDNAD